MNSGEKTSSQEANSDEEYKDYNNYFGGSCLYPQKEKKMWFIFLAARSAVVLRGPVDQTKILRKDQSCRGEEDGTK